MVLRAIREAIEEEVDSEKGQAPDGVVRVPRRRGLFGRGRVVQGEHGHTGCNQENDEILVERIAFSEDCEVQEHHGEKLA